MDTPQVQRRDAERVEKASRKNRKRKSINGSNVTYKEEDISHSSGARGVGAIALPLPPCCLPPYAAPFRSISLTIRAQTLTPPMTRTREARLFVAWYEC